MIYHMLMIGIFTLPWMKSRIYKAEPFFKWKKKHIYDCHGQRSTYNADLREYECVSVDWEYPKLCHFRNGNENKFFGYMFI